MSLGVAPSASRGRVNSYFTRRTSYFPRKSDSHPISLQYFTFYNELRNVCSLKPEFECHCCANAEVSAAIDIPDDACPEDVAHQPPPVGIEEMQFNLYLREIQRLNPSLKEGCLFVDGLYELVSSRLPKAFEGKSPSQGSPRDLLTVHSSGTLLLQKYWHRPDDPTEYSAYLTVAASFVEYIHFTYGPKGVGRFLRRLDCTVEDPLEEGFTFNGRDILSLEFKWNKHMESQVNEQYRLSTLGMVGELLRRHLAKYWCLLAIILAIIIADVALHLVFAIASGDLVAYGHRASDHELHNVSSLVQHGEALVPLLLRGGILLAAILTRFVLVMFSNVLQAFIAVNVSKKLRRNLSSRLHQVTPKFLDDHSASSIISTFVQDVSTIEGVISSGLRAVIWGVLMLITCITYALITAWPLGLGLTAVFLIGQIVANVVSSVFSDHGFAKSQATNKLCNLLKEQIDGFHINKLYGLSEFWMQQVNSVLCRQYSQKARKSFILTKFILMFQMLVPNIIGAMLTFAIILLTQLDMLRFDRGLAIFVFFTTTVISLTAASSLFPQLQAAAVSLGRINALLNSPTHTSNEHRYQQKKVNPTSSLTKVDPRDLGALPVEFKSVCFSYSSMASHWNLFDIDLKVEAGERVAIVGQSGSGKSTLLHLLMKMYEPTHGSVAIGDDTHKDKGGLQVAATFQFNHIFNMSIRDNIRVGQLSATDSEVEKAAEQADLHAWICSQPRGYDTAVSSGGSSLSGGQKQRIAIARMLLSGAPVFVLDEVTSALDPTTEKRVFSKLMEVSEGKTVVAVTHRLDQAEAFDRIIVLSHGRIKEQGTHSQLMAERGTYWQMRTNRQTTPDKAVPILRRRGSLPSEVPLFPATATVPAMGQPLLVTPAFLPLHTLAELGETCVESTVNNTSNTVSIPSIKVINASISRYSRADNSGLAIDSSLHPMKASTPDPHNAPPTSAKKVVVNVASFSDSQSVHQGSVNCTAERRRSQLASIRQDITVLYLDENTESKNDISQYNV